MNRSDGAKENYVCSLLMSLRGCIVCKKERKKDLLTSFKSQNHDILHCKMFHLEEQATINAINLTVLADN